MSAETTSAQGFPTPCTRCGGVLYQHVDFCPYCGANHPLDKAQRKRASTQLRPVDTQPPHLPVIAPDPSGLPALASPDIPIPPLAVPHHWQAAGRWVITKGLVLLLFAGAFGYAAWLLLGDNHRQETGDDTINSASTVGGSISPYTAIPAPRASAQSAQSALQSATQSTAARSTATATSVNAPFTSITPARIAPPKPPVVPHYRDLAEALRAAHTGLVHNNLAQAKSALADAMSIEPNNADASLMQSDIVDREKKRDAALNVASTCAKDKLWSCVREHAANALAIDVSSADAQSLLERMILSTGWKPLSNAAPTTAATTSASANANTNGKPALPSLPPAIATKNTATATSVAANPVATNAPAGHAASAASGVDAQMRAILESGWKHPPSASK